MPSGHIDPMAPLKPLSAHAWGWLAALAQHDYVAHEINPGVRNRLHREQLIEFYTAGLVVMVRITPAGREKLKERP